MRTIGLSFSFSLLVLLLIAAGSSADQKLQWKWKIEIENGVKVIKNPTDPLYGDFAFDLEENLVVGGDPSKENAYFPKGAVLSVDDKGNLYVADFGNRRVHMFDQTGKFVRAIGRQGQGPGEYSFPGRVMFDAEGNPCVWASRDMLRYGQDGQFKAKIAIKTFLNNSMIGPGGTIIGTTQPGRGPDGPKYTIVQLDADGAPLRTLAEYRGEFRKDQTVIYLHWYSNHLSFAPLTGEVFAYGFSEDYRLNVADAEGRTKYVITKDEKPVSISGKEKDENEKSGIYAMMGTNERNLKNEDLPGHRPYFGGISTDDAGHIYVARTKSILEKDKPSQIDVFSKDGYFLYRMSWSVFPSAIKSGFFYAVRQDKETGENQVVRYRIKNWSQMKNGL
jgi:hypothetical protein